mgnify:CR=1 FL=1
MRGEYEQQPCSQVLTMELPPRARRIRDFSDLLHHYLGTTSACAENTDDHASEACHTRNYLRVRGEYAAGLLIRFGCKELPPRARRIQCCEGGGDDAGGTTSACAENTPRTVGRSSNPGNYLRVRGEYNAVRVVAMTRAELPPRARRILLEQSGDLQIQGTTSACAENTARILADSWPVRNYLRVRGEYS